MNIQSFNRQELINMFGTELRLGEVFDRLEKQMSKTGQVVCLFKINGMSLDEEAEKRFSQSSLQEVDLIEVQTQDPSILLVNVVDGWIQQIPTFIERTDLLAQDIRIKGLDGQMNQIVDLIDSCQMLIESLISIDSVLPENPIVQGEYWLKYEKSTATAVGETLDAFQRRDINLLADLLEYDLAHSLQCWLEILTNFKDYIEQERVNSASRP